LFSPLLGRFVANRLGGFTDLHQSSYHVVTAKTVQVRSIIRICFRMYQGRRM
jgi:hypothetical protein